MLLDFNQTRKILSKYKIPFCRSEVFKSKKEALKFAKIINFPVVLKIMASQVLHRTEIGGVKIGIKNKEEFKRAFDEILFSTKKKKINFEGVLVQKEMKGTEIAIGMKRDEIFGPVIMFGGGGIFIELLKDVSFGICPLKTPEIKEMIKETKIYGLLKGFRGFPKVNIEKIIKIAQNLSKLSLKDKKIKEIDLNPIICNEKEILVVDAKIII